MSFAHCVIPFILNILPIAFATRSIAANMTAAPTEIFRSVRSNSNSSGGIPVADCGSVVVPVGITVFAINLNGNIVKLAVVIRKV
jgi:hypothetical protein